MRSPICYIYGAGEQTKCDARPTASDIVIAADGGYDYVRSIGLSPDYVLGDFDSVDATDLPSDAIRYPSRKDDTDLMLAVRLGLDKGYISFRIYGGLGGRLDHTIGNIQILDYLSHHGACGVLIGDTYSVTVITDDSICIKKDRPENKPGNACSIFSLSDTSEDVSIQGLSYEVEHTTLTNTYPLGISNEYTGKDATISVGHGSLMILWYHG